MDEVNKKRNELFKQRNALVDAYKRTKDQVSQIESSILKIDGKLELLAEMEVEERRKRKEQAETAKAESQEGATEPSEIVEEVVPDSRPEDPIEETDE